MLSGNQEGTLRMLANTNVDMPVKPRVLIADDSRIVRATLIKRIEGIFDFREAMDGEQAWEAILIDPSIRVVITDLTMPKLDGYGLLERIRSSKISRIRNLPVVVVSGSDEQAERDRAKAAGATDLITKGIGAAQLLSRLDILSNLLGTQKEFERDLEILVRNTGSGFGLSLASADALEAQAAGMLENAGRAGKNFVLLNVCIGLKHTVLEGAVAIPPSGVVNAIGQLLQRSVRQSDVLAQTSEGEFTLATGSIQFDSARNFGQRICGAVAGAHFIKNNEMSFVASCGLVSLSEFSRDAGKPSHTLKELRAIARRRGVLGWRYALSGVIGAEEEFDLQHGALPVERVPPSFSEPSPDLPTLLRWIGEGKQDQVLRHVDKLAGQLQPLIDLIQQHGKS